MPEIRHVSGLMIYTEPKQPHTSMGRRWDDVVKAMIASGSIILRENEVVTGVAIDPTFGLLFSVAELPSKTNCHMPSPVLA